MLTGATYFYSTANNYLDYEFESAGKKGVIKKLARFTKINDDLYSFGFGDLQEATGEIDDLIVSNNGDGDKVLFTVANIIYDFTSIYIGAAVLIEGSTPARTRRYQMGISKFWKQIEPEFDILGLYNEDWEPFQASKNYLAFLGMRKPEVFRSGK